MRASGGDFWTAYWDLLSDAGDLWKNKGTTGCYRNS